MKIEVGCGNKGRKEGFLTCDVRPLPGVDIVCDAWDIDKHVAPCSVELIYSRHFFEHLTFKQGEMFLRACHRILKVGGIYEMKIPNMELHVRQWLNDESLDHSRAGFWGWQRGELNDIWDLHKSGYKFSHLADLMAQIGYSDIRQLPSKMKHLHIVGVKEMTAEDEVPVDGESHALPVQPVAPAIPLVDPRIAALENELRAKDQLIEHHKYSIERLQTLYAEALRQQLAQQGIASVAE